MDIDEKTLLDAQIKKGLKLPEDFLKIIPSPSEHAQTIEREHPRIHYTSLLTLIVIE